jgi:hypothetical protein
MRARSFDYLVNEAARVLAEVADSIWDRESTPVPIEAIAEHHYGLRVRDGDIGLELPGEGPAGEQRASGALIPERAEIWVDATEASLDPRRRRYAIAHELGHWELHRGPDGVFCGEAAVAPLETVTRKEGGEPGTWPWQGDPGDANVEWEANVFGGAMLLPPWLVRRVWEETQSLDALAEAFDCSLSQAESGWQHSYAFIGS